MVRYRKPDGLSKPNMHEYATVQSLGLLDTKTGTGHTCTNVSPNRRSEEVVIVTKLGHLL